MVKLERSEVVGCTTERSGQAAGVEETVANNPIDSTVRSESETEPSAPTVAWNVNAPEYVPPDSTQSIAQVYSAELLPEELLEVRVEVSESTSTFRALIDTGSDSVLIKNCVVQELGLQLDGSQTLELRGVGKDNCHQGLGTVSLKLTLYGNLLDEFTFQVVPDGTIGCDFVLGRPFLRRNKLVICPGSGIIRRCGSSGDQWTYQLNQGRVQKIQCVIPCKAKESKPFSSGDVFLVSIGNVDDSVPFVNNEHPHSYFEIFYDGEIQEPRLKCNLQAWAGLMSKDSTKIMIQVDKGAGNGRIKEGDILGHLVYTIENECDLSSAIQPEADADFWTRDKIREALEFDDSLTSDQQNQLVSVLEEN